MKRQFFHSILLAILVVFLMNSSAWAVPQLVNFHNFERLIDSAGVMDGFYTLNISIYNDEFEVTAIWSEEQNINVIDGFINVHLGADEAFPANMFENDNLYIEILKLNSSTGEYELISPRSRITSAAFSMKAMKADDADTLDGRDSTQFAQVRHTHSFSDISGSASDAQIPNNITINNARNADTVDGKHANQFLDTSGTTQTKSGGLNIDGQIRVNDSIRAKDSGGIALRTDDNKTRFFVNDNGRVGVNTVVPGSQLDVNGEIRVNDSIRARDGGGIALRTDEGTTRLFVRDNGNVGIGTRSPDEKLHVNGAVKIGNLKFWGNRYGDFQSSGDLRPHIGSGNFTIYSGNVGSGRERFKVQSNGDIKVNGSTPIILKRYNNLGDLVNEPTGYRYSEYAAAIAGFYTEDVNIRSSGSGNFIKCRMTPSVLHGESIWHIQADLRSASNPENWYIDVLFISRKLATVLDY